MVEIHRRDFYLWRCMRSLPLGRGRKVKHNPYIDGRRSKMTLYDAARKRGGE